MVKWSTFVRAMKILFIKSTSVVPIFHNAVKSINTILKQLGLEKPKSEEKDDTSSFDLNKFLNEN